MVLGVRWAGLSISATADLLGVSVSTESGAKKRNYPASASVEENALLM